MISVIVPVYNGEGTLRACLGALRASRGDGLELVVVNDRSTDASPEVARSFGARVVDNEGPRGPAGARNTGARHAKGDILVFIDADVVVHGDTLRRLEARFEGHPELAAVFGSYDAAPSEPNFISQYRNLLHHYVHQRSNAEARTFWAGCGAIRRAAYEEVGGFDQERYRQASIEDIELGLRLSEHGHRILLDRDIQATHLKRWTLRGMLDADISKRALPWSKLIIAKGSMPNDLNLRVSARVSGVLVVFSALLVPAILAAALLPAPGWLLAAGVAAFAVALAIVLVLNRDVYAFFLAARGFAFMLGSVVMHLFYYLYASATFAYCRLRYR